MLDRLPVGLVVSLQMNKELYNGWLIEFIAEPTGFAFQCWLPENRISVGDRKVYPTLESARIAAQTRADLEAVKWALKHCYATYIEGNLSPDEYFTLEHLIMDVLAPANP